MGFHTCSFCSDDESFFGQTSSGDITMKFASGRSWQMPDMIIHHIADHGWQPPVEFIEDVMSMMLVGGHRAQTKGVSAAPTKVGYLTEKFNTGPISWELVGKLAALMQKAARIGNRSQTRGG